jgi:hypothetical protein
MPFESDFQKRGDQIKGPSKGPLTDRKLGDEWMEWDGMPEEEINEPEGRFILLTSLVWVLFTTLMVLGGYLAAPRVRQWSPTIQVVVEVAFFALLGGGLILYSVIMLEVLTERVAVLPYTWSERMMLWLLPKAIWFGEKMGISRDRVGNSFVKVNNALTRSYAKRINRAKLLILLPRCLNRDTRRDILTLLSGQPYSLATVGGGEEARKAIRDARPSFIIAVACERDLVSGIRDVALHIPVIGVPNKRPEGPCKNTYIDMEDFRRALRFFMDSGSVQDNQAIANV